MDIPENCDYCGANLKGAVVRPDGRVICPVCKADVINHKIDPDEARANDEPGQAPAENVDPIRHLIETTSSDQIVRGSVEVDGFGNVVATAHAEPRSARFPFLMMLVVTPVAVIFIAAGMSAVLTNEWDAVTGCLVCGAGALLVLAGYMRGRWTIGRVIWTMCLLLLFSASAINVGFGRREVLPFKPLEAEFSAWRAANKPAAGAELESMPPLRPKLFPLVIHSRADRNQDAHPVRIPRMLRDVEIYKQLPPQLKPASLDEVHTIVLLDWGWTKRGEAPVAGAGNVYIGTCEVNVLDRATHAIIAQTTLQSDKSLTSVEAGRLTSDWYGPQPLEKDVLAYINSLTFIPDK